MVDRLRRLARGAYGWLAGSYQRRVMNVLLLALALDYADRSLVGALGPTLKRVFDIDNFQLGLLASSYLFVGAIVAIPIGMLTDRINRTALLAVSFLLWSVATGVAGAATVFALFLGARLLLGFASASYGPITPSLVGDLVPAAQRGGALGKINLGFLVGLALGYILPAVLTSFVSWRWCFWLLAIAGACLAYSFWHTSEPERTSQMGPSEEDGSENKDEQGESQVRRMVRERGIEPSRRAMVEGDPAEMSMWEAAKYTVRVRTDLLALTARSLGDFYLQGLATFAVTFVINWYGLSQRSAYIALMVAGVGAIAGVLILSRLSDALLRRGRLNSRIWVGGIGYLLTAAVLFPAFSSHSLAVSLPLYTVGAFFLAGSRPPLDAVRIDVLVGKLRGRAEAIRQVSRSLVEGAAPILLGAFSAAVGGGARGLQIAFLITLIALVLNGIIMLIALRTYQPDVAAAVASTEDRQ